MRSFARSPEKKTARIRTVACGILFCTFSFIYLFAFQEEVIRALHYSLAHGQTYYDSLMGAVIITTVLLGVRWAINKLTGPTGAWSWFLPCLLLGVLTDVDHTAFHEGGFASRWAWLLPLLFLIYIGMACAARRLFPPRKHKRKEKLVQTLLCHDLTILFFLFLMTMTIGNTCVNFHHELAVEHAIRRGDYADARRVGQKSLETSRTLTVLRAYAMAWEGTMGEHLFEYPQEYGSKGLFFEPHSRETLLLNADSLYAGLGVKPYMTEQETDFLARAVRDTTARTFIRDYYLCALLLEKRIEEFASALGKCFPGQQADSLPRHYREAVALHEHLSPSPDAARTDSLTTSRLNQFLERREEFVSPREEKNRMRREYGDTYWWYYHYQ